MPRCVGLSTGPCPANRNDNSVRIGEGDLMLCPECDRTRHLEFLASHQAKSSPPISTSGSTGTSTAAVSTRSSGKQGSSRQNDISKTTIKPEICKTVTVMSAAKNGEIDRAKTFFLQ